MTVKSFAEYANTFQFRSSFDAWQEIYRYISYRARHGNDGAYATLSELARRSRYRTWQDMLNVHAKAISQYEEELASLDSLSAMYGEDVSLLEEQLGLLSHDDPRGGYAFRSNNVSGHVETNEYGNYIGSAGSIAISAESVPSEQIPTTYDELLVWGKERINQSLIELKAFKGEVLEKVEIVGSIYSLI